MRRIGLVLVLILTASLAAEGQQAPKIPKIGLLTLATPAAAAPLVEAFRQELRALGYVEGKTFVLQIRYGEAKAERLRELARDLVALKMDVIVVAQDQAVAAVKREAGTTIPIVMSNSSDPVGTGFVASLAHPGGSITGLSNVSPELSGKRLELLRQVLPGLSRVAFLWNPDVRGNLLDYKETEGAARSLRVELQSVEVSSDEDLDRGFSAVMAQHAQALILPAGNAVAFSKRPEIASFAQRNRLPAMYPNNDWMDAGGLMSYGPSSAAMYHRAAIYVDRILKGAKPADLPVERPTKFELVINLKTAKALGLTIPPSVLGRADQVIE
jgi:putative ABC transport system substrate-binding protein